MVRPLEGKLEDLAQPGTMLLFQGQADRLKVQVGDVITLSAPTSRGVNNTADVKVVVVARNVGILSAFSSFIEKRTLNQLYGIKDSTTGALQLYLKDPTRAAGGRRPAAGPAWPPAGYRVMDPDPQPYWMKLDAEGAERGLDRPEARRDHLEDEMGQFTQFITGVRWVSWLVVSVLLLVVIIGILNTMAIAIRERTREIGTLRAIGMQRRKVLWLFVLETGLLGLAGAAAGRSSAPCWPGCLNLAGIWRGREHAVLPHAGDAPLPAPARPDRLVRAGLHRR